MTVQLTSQDQEMLAGGQGPGAQMAMRIVLRMAAFHGVDRLLDISQAHIDSSIYLGEAGLEFAEKLAGLGAKVRVPSTLNVSGLDEHGWREWDVPQDWAHNAHRQMIAYQKMGCRPIWTCAPYQKMLAQSEGVELRPRFGEQIAWGESNAIVFANSVLGARTERYPDLMDICAAITGRVPAAGLHLDENRGGQIHMPLADIPLEIQQQDVFYPVLGHLIGKIARDRIPVLSGLQVQPDEDQLKALGAASASSGTVALFHMVGVTPEAPSLAAAFRGRAPEHTYPVTRSGLRSAWQELTTADGEELDMVVLGSPHFSLAEFRRLAPLLSGRRRHPDVQFLVTSSRAMVSLADRAGYLEPLRAFGGKITVDTCILASPMLPSNIRRLMTNSAKYAYYAPGLLRAEITFGSLEECVHSAVLGEIARDKNLWKSVL